MNKTMLATLATALLAPGLAGAVETSFDGFFTLGTGRVSESGVEYAGYDEDGSFKPDSVAGLQFSADFSDRFGAVGQVILRGDEDFEPEIEWAYLKFSATENLMLRVGRLRPPLFAVSDYYDVGFAYPWVRPIEEVYANAPITHHDGVDFILSHRIGGWDATLQGYYGNEDGEQIAAGSLTHRDIDSLMGITYTVDKNFLSLRASVHGADVTLDVEALRPLFAALRSTPYGSVADDVEFSDKSAVFSEVAVTYDADSWYIRAEASTTNFDRSFSADQASWYVTGGFRYEEFEPYLTFSRLETDPDGGYSDPIPNGVDPLLDALKQSVDAVIAGGKTDRSVVTIGARWNALDTVSFKAEFGRVNNKLPGGIDFNVTSLVAVMLF